MTPAKGLLVGVGDLLGRPGSRHSVQRDLVVEELSVLGATVPQGSTVQVDLVIEATAEPGTLTVTGTVRAPWRGECRRCLDPIEGEIEADVHDVVARRPVDEEVWELQGEEVDVGAIAREALMLALPLSPLCGPDCLGPAPDEFPAVAIDQGDPGDGAADGAGEPPLDPRWAALDQLRFDPEPPPS